MTLEAINRALQHPFKIRDASSLTLKSISEATLDNLSKLKEDLSASTLEKTALSALLENQNIDQAALKVDLEERTLQLAQAQADLSDRDHEIATLDQAIISFGTGWKAMTELHNERKAAKEKAAGEHPPSPSKMQVGSPSKSGGALKLESPVKLAKIPSPERPASPKKARSPAKFA